MLQMPPETMPELAQAIAADRDAGRTPLVVSTNAGTPSRGRGRPAASACGHLRHRAGLVPRRRGLRWVRRTDIARRVDSKRASTPRTRLAWTRTSSCSSRTRPVAS